MNALRQERRLRKSRPGLEQLDLRIAPAATPVAALAAELRVETRQVGRWEASVAIAKPGSHRETVLTNHIARTEGRMAVQEARLARIEARNVFTPGGPVPLPPSRPVSQAPTTVSAPASFVGTAPVTPTVTAPTVTSPTSSTPATTGTGSTSTLPANVSQTLDVIYNTYEQDPSAVPTGLPVTDDANNVQMQGTNVGIQVHDGNPADFSALVSNLESAGMQITISSAASGTVVGFLPIAQLPTIAAFSDAPSITPLFNPTLL
jgi:hypothetical protein